MTETVGEGQQHSSLVSASEEKKEENQTMEEPVNSTVPAPQAPVPKSSEEEEEEDEGEEEEEEETETSERTKPSTTPEAAAVLNESKDTENKPADKHEEIEELISFFDDQHPPEPPVSEVTDNCVTAVDSPSPRRENCESPAMEVEKEVHFSAMESADEAGDSPSKRKKKGKKKKKITKKVEEPSTHSYGTRQDSPSKAHRVIEVQDVARAKSSIARNRPSSRPSSPQRGLRDGEINIATYIPYHTVLVENTYVRPVVVTMLIPEKLKDMSPAKARPKAKDDKTKMTKNSIESSEDEVMADDDDSVDAKQDKESTNIHDIKHLKHFVVKVNDVVSNKDAVYAVVLRDFRTLLKDLIHEYEDARVSDYYQPNSLKWWARYIKKLVLVFDRPNGQLSILVDKKAIRRIIKKKMEHHQWMLASISVSSNIVQSGPSMASPSHVQEEVTVDVTVLEANNDEVVVDEFSSTYKHEHYAVEDSNYNHAEESVDGVLLPSDEAKVTEDQLILEPVETVEEAAQEPVEDSQPTYDGSYEQAAEEHHEAPTEENQYTYDYSQEGYAGQSYDESHNYQYQNESYASSEYPVDENGNYISNDPNNQYDNSSAEYDASYYQQDGNNAYNESYDSAYGTDNDVEYLFQEDSNTHSVTLPSVLPESSSKKSPEKKKKAPKNKSADHSGGDSLPSINRGKSNQSERITPAMAKMNELLSKAYAPIKPMYTEEDIENIMKPPKKHKKIRAKSLVDLPSISQEPSLQLSDDVEAPVSLIGEMPKAESSPVLLAPIIPNRSPSFISVLSADSKSIKSRPLSPFERDVQGLRGPEKRAADIIIKARKTIFHTGKNVKKKISQTEAKLLASPFAKKILIEKPNVEELLSDLSVKDGKSAKSGKSMSSANNSVNSPNPM